jgi:photosystem II stability/assembly factor-like uncharacterized protein
MRIIYKFCLGLILFSVACSNRNHLSVELNTISLQTNSNASLRGLFVVNENVIWASGSEGTVLLSVDGGESWKVNQILGAEKNDFRSIYAWSEKRAMVFGVAGPEFGFLTEDAGKSWNIVYRDTTAGLFFNSLKFADDKNGLAVSDPVEGKLFVIRTEDGGLNWKRVGNIPDIIEGEANFAASNTCIEFLPSGKAWIATGGKVSRVFYSEDFGKSWNVSETPIISGETSSGIFSVSFKNELEGVIVGGTYDKPEQNTNIAAYTNDGGETWNSSETMPKEYRSCVQLINNVSNNFFFAMGKTGCDFSADSGKNWQYISDTGYYTFRAIPGKFAGFAAGANGSIAKIDFN